MTMETVERVRRGRRPKPEAERLVRLVTMVPPHVARRAEADADRLGQTISRTTLEYIVIGQAVKASELA